MAIQTKTKQAFENDTGFHERYHLSTIGIVVDTSDPQQMGRVRVICPSWGESYDTSLLDLPWALYLAPFGGTTETGTRGPDVSQSSGPVAYGFWAVPKVGASVVVQCIDGDPQHRVYIGSVHAQLATHTMPHGRWMYDDHPDLNKAGAQVPYGPFTTTENPIEPLSSNLQRAFGPAEDNHEWRTRAADYSVSATDINHLSNTYSRVADDKDITHEEWVSRQGYPVSRIAPHVPGAATDKNYDSVVYSMTTPGFHSLSMDDRQENCRVRFRTSSGHQIILDDTNERIYISTAEGRNWIEMDQQGNIAAFTEGTYSVRARGDINLTSDESIRLHGKEVHVYAKEEMRLQSGADTNLKVGSALRVRSEKHTMVEAGGALHIRADGDVLATSGASMHLKTAHDINVDSQTTINLLATTSVVGTADRISLNGSMTASPATAAALADEQPAKWTSMVPDHEPYARTMTKNDFVHDPELPYSDPNVGKKMRSRWLFRGRFWRR